MTARHRLDALLPLSVFLLSTLACGATPLKEAGRACTADSDCAAGLSCLGIGSLSDAGCTPVIKACSHVCAADSDCVPLGSSFKCFNGCNGTSSCGATQ
jgi:hypothetical protein